MLNQYEGWAVGDGATILHYTVSGGVGTWSLITVSGTPSLSQYANLTSIFMLSPTSGWAVGGISCLYVGAGGNCGTPAAAIAGPVIIYWDGTKWEPVSTPSIPGGITLGGAGILEHTDAMLKSVFFTSANDGWAVGFPGVRVATVLHWDGYAWAHVSLSPSLLGEIPPILSSVYMTSTENGWIVGGSPDFACIPSTSCTATGGSSQYFGEAGPQTATTGGPYGYKTPLSTVLHFSPFGGIFTATSTVTLVSTVSTSTTALTASTVTTVTSGFTVPSPNVTISVKIVDNQGNPVQGVTVAIPSVAQQGVTNSQGVVNFTLLPGTYTVNFTRGAISGTQSINPSTNGQVFTITVSSSGIPGFPVESILAGMASGLLVLMLIRRRRSRQ
jgi:hypothetical protein